MRVRSDIIFRITHCCAKLALLDVAVAERDRFVVAAYQRHATTINMITCKQDPGGAKY